MRGRASIPQDVRETLGENIRRERVIRKMTQAELAQKIGTSQMMVSVRQFRASLPLKNKASRLKKIRLR